MFEGTESPAIKSDIAGSHVECPNVDGFGVPKHLACWRTQAAERVDGSFSLKSLDKTYHNFTKVWREEFICISLPY